MEEWTFGDGRGVTNPTVVDAKRCPQDCGLCSMHTSHSGLANLDLTNRCNLTCPVCFANANVAGYVYEPPLEQVRMMLQTLRDEKPVAGRIVQFSGGEPTVYPQFFEALSAAKELGFSHIQVATNGIRFAEPEFAQQAKEAGLHTLYLQFDGVTDDVYLRTRGRRLAELKFRAIENVRQAGMKICFVPTIVKGVNDHQIGDILRVALDNIDVVSAISFQPVAFTGRIARAELESKRFTLADFAHAVHAPDRHLRSVRGLVPAGLRDAFLEAPQRPARRADHASLLPPAVLAGHLSVRFALRRGRSGHAVRGHAAPCCARWNALSRKVETQRIKLFSKISAWNMLRKHFHEDRAPEGLTFNKFLQTLQGLMDKDYGRGEAEQEGFTFKTLMVAGMHFMDHYNYDVERVKRCVIHYAAPDGQIYPFCAYNGGPTFRERIEQKYSVALPEEQLV